MTEPEDTRETQDSKYSNLFVKLQRHLEGLESQVRMKRLEERDAKIVADTYQDAAHQLRTEIDRHQREYSEKNS